MTAGEAVEPLEWADHAACIGTDPDVFFPDGGDTVTLARALRICAKCDVRAQCLAHALANPKDCAFGVWGGLSARERRRMLRGRR